MDIRKAKYKNSRKCDKKSTKILHCMQKHTIPKNYHSETEKLFHQSIRVDNLLTEKCPAGPQVDPESCKYYIVKRRFAVKQRKLGKNGACLSHSQEQSHRCKQTQINKFFIAPSSYALEAGRFNKILKKKCQYEKLKNDPDPDSINNKLFQTESFTPKISTSDEQKDVCLMNAELNSENALFFQCSAASLQLEQSNVIETKKTNSNTNFNSMQTSENTKKKENYNDINYILPKLMQHVTVYRILENLKGEHFYQNNCEDDMYSSMSTCSSSSSTREYYLPAVSSSTDTMKVANVLANRRLIGLPNAQDEMSLKQTYSNQGICKNTYNNSYSKFSPVYQQRPLKNHQIIKLLKDNNDGILPFFPFTNFNSLLIKNKARVIKKCEQSSIGVQTQESNIYEKVEDDSFDYNTMKNKRIKLSKGNFIMNNNTKNNESLGMNMEKINKKPLNSLSLATNPNCEKFMKNFNNTNKGVMKILSEHLYDAYLHTNRKEKLSIDHNGSISNLSNISMPRPKNKSISEDMLITIKDKDNKTHKIKTEIQKPQSSLCFSKMKSQTSELPMYLKAYPNASNDSFDVSKPHLVKLKPFFDAGFKDPKISKLILSSKTLAGESDSTIDKAKIQRNFIDTIVENQSQQKYVESATLSKMTNNYSMNEEKYNEVKHSCTSNMCVFSADSILYGGKAFQKIREKFNLLQNKIQIDEENEQIQEQGSFNKQRVFTPKHSWKTSYEGLNNIEDNSQLTDRNNSMNINTQHSSFSMSENPQKISTVSFENGGTSDKNKYLLLLPKKLDISNYKPEHSVKEFNHINNEEKTIGFPSFHGKSVDISLMNDDQELININLKGGSSKELTPLLGNNKITKPEKGTIETKHLSEKQTQVNMYLVETCEKQVGDAISNDIPLTRNEEISAALTGKEAQAALLNDNQAKAIMSNNSNQTEATMFNNGNQTEAPISNYNNGHREAKMSNNNNQAEAKLLDNYGQPIILYNSSGYPITDLNGRVLKNNLGAYLLNTDNYSDVITKQLPVFDCDLMSVSSTCFNPTKVPFVKTQFKITDRGGNPVSLFNNLGWPLTNEDGFFLHDNHGKLLVAMDSFNFPLCCSNGSPVYLQNGAMLLSQKFKFIVTKPGSNSDFTKRSLKIGRRYENEVVISSDKKDDKISDVKPINYCKTARQLNESIKKDLTFNSLNFRKPKVRKPNYKYSLFLPTEVPELMHEFFDNKTRPRFSNLRSHGSIPQSPIPIFDMDGNRLTDEKGFPLKNKYGEYMLLLDKNGIALSDSCGGPIFDSNGKQLWLKDLYHMKKRPSFNYLYDRYMPPERPYIDTSTSNHNQNINDSSDDVIPLLDINFEDEQNSEPIMNYIKENKIKTYDIDTNKVHYFKNKSHRTNRKPERMNLLSNVSAPTNENHYLQSPMAIKENLILYETSYQEEAEYRNLYDSSGSQIHDSNVPYTYTQSVLEDCIFSEQPHVDNLEQYKNNYYYDEQEFPENFQFHQDAEIRYYIDDNNYVMYY